MTKIFCLPGDKRVLIARCDVLHYLSLPCSNLKPERFDYYGNHSTFLALELLKALLN